MFCALQAFTDTSVSIEPRQEPTGLPLPTLQWVGRSIATVPRGFRLHPEVQRMLDARRRGRQALTRGRKKTLQTGTVAALKGGSSRVAWSRLPC